MTTKKNIWRIYKTSRGWHSVYGTLIVTPAPNTNCTVSKFNTYESVRYDTKNQAVKFAKEGGLTKKRFGEIIVVQSV